MKRFASRGILLVLAPLLVVTLFTAQAGATTTYPIGTIGDGLATEIFASTSMPPGSNNWACKPTAAHPRPVILVHGTFANEAFSWQALSPMLANAGYCVFAFNYGATWTTLSHFYGLDHVATSAGQLSSFVNKVLTATGASKVDMVGHSQGGMMPRYYTNKLGGASKVGTLIGLAPSNHGTTFWGVSKLVLNLQLLGLDLLGTIGCYSCNEQMAGSSFLNSLNSGGDTVAGPKYVVIETKYDEVVTPYTSAFLTGPNVTNITLQNQCPTDYTEHIGIIYDPITLQNVMNWLGPKNPSFQPTCSVVWPVVSG